MSIRRILSVSLCLLSGLGILSLSGCGVDPSTHPLNVPAFLQGVAHGGPQPIVGATVSLYATTSNGYGAPAVLLGTAISGTDGGFHFVSPAMCPADQQAYMTSSGGDPGSGTNPNYLLIAALGPCSTISSSTYVWMDEVTTVAAAFALRPFMTITTSGGVPVVNIGAPANNNAASGTCATVAGATTSCTAAGLSHAFANALNLANSVSIAGAAPNGTAYAVTPSNPNGVAPAALINSLADSIEACVNSRGGVAADSSICGDLFTYTTPPIAGAIAPANTLQALLNVAQYPALTPENVTNLFGLANSISFYGPALSTAPTDFSVGIAYTGVSVSGTAIPFGNPFAMTLDANDNVYLGTSTATTSQETALASNGASLWAAPVNTTYITPRGSGTDTLGHVWVAQNSVTAGKFTIQCFLQSSGSACPPSTFTPVAGANIKSNLFNLVIDKGNNIWYSLNGTAGQNLYEDTQASGWTANAVFPNVPKFPAGPHGIAIDSNQNIWTANYFPTTTTTSIGIFPNTGTAAAPAYAGTALTLTLSGNSANGVALDANNNAWIPSSAGLFEVTPTFTSATVTGLTTTATVTESSAAPFFSSIDGSGNSWIPDNTNQAMVQYVAGTGAVAAYSPCYVPNGAQTCAPMFASPTRTQVDSTGSVWITSVTNMRVVQMLGTATPTWPQLSLTAPGVAPQ